MKYCIRWLKNGRVHYFHTDGHDTAIMAFEALADAGYLPELWSGATRNR